MLKKFILITSILFSPCVIADTNNADMNDNNSKACEIIANACLNAGYKDKAFWQDCMKPVILGKSVSNVTVDTPTIKTCRRDKIKQMKDQLKQFKQADQ